MIQDQPFALQVESLYNTNKHPNSPFLVLAGLSDLKGSGEKPTMQISLLGISELTEGSHTPIKSKL